MEVHENFASKGVAGAALGTGIGGLALGVLNSGILGPGGLNWGRGFGYGACAEDPYTSRYEMGLHGKIAELETEVKLRDANIYTDQKLLELFKYFDGELKGINGQLSQQGVINAQITANLGCLQNAVNTLSGLTKTVIPIDSLCPEVMRRFNTWVAPTATAPDTGATT